MENATAPSGTITISQKEYQSFLRQESEIALLKHQLSELKRMIFGSRSERFVAPPQEQLSLDLGLGDTGENKEVKTQTITYGKKISQKKKGHARLPIPAHIPRVDIHIEPREDITGARKIGEAVTEILEYRPGTLYVNRYIRPKYILERGEEAPTIVMGELPSLPVPKGNAGASLLSHIIVGKYVDHLPFHRQSKMFKRQGVHLPESTINDWFSASCKLLEPLYGLSRDKVQKCGYLMADETGIPVQTKHRAGSTHDGYFWVYYDPLGKVPYLEYHPSRKKEVPQSFLSSFQGTLQTDGYTGYNGLGKKQGIRMLACMAHARRKFREAMDNNKELAGCALEAFQVLYRIERVARVRGLSHERRHRLRQRLAVPVLGAMERAMRENLGRVSPKSPIGKALIYNLNLWPRLSAYVEDGKYEIDNNPIENTIRPIAIGRKNYMFAGSHKGARRAAMAYTFFATCKMHGVEPFAWLTDVLGRIQDTKVSQLENLLPQNWEPGNK